MGGCPARHAGAADQLHRRRAGVWRTVHIELRLKHARLACEDCCEAVAALGLPTDRIPQLDERLGVVGARG